MQFNLDEQLTMTADHQQYLKKKTKFFKLNAEIQVLQKEINANSKNTFLDEHQVRTPPPDNHNV